MKKISFWLLVFALATAGGRAQDTATQQQLDKLAGQLQDISDAEALQGKRLDALEHDLADLRDKVNTPAANNYASSDDLQKLAAQLQEIDKKRQGDRELILDKIQELAKLSAASPAPTHVHHSEPKDNADEPTQTVDATDTPHYEYTVLAGDNLSAIIKAFREKGVKVSLTQVLKANPGLNANTLYVGKTIIIPKPAAK